MLTQADTKSHKDKDHYSRVNASSLAELCCRNRKITTRSSMISHRQPAFQRTHLLSQHTAKVQINKEQGDSEIGAAAPRRWKRGCTECSYYNKVTILLANCCIKVTGYHRDPFQLISCQKIQKKMIKIMQGPDPYREKEHVANIVYILGEYCIHIGRNKTGKPGYRVREQFPCVIYW